MNVILNTDRTRKNVVSVSEEEARSPGSPIDINQDDIFVTNAPDIPVGLHTPQLLEDNVTWVEANQAAADADAVEKNILAIKAKAQKIIYAQYTVEKQNNMQTRYKELESIIMGTYPNDDGTFAPARSLTAEEIAEMVTLRQAWDWIKAVRTTSNDAEANNTPVDDVVWP